MLKHFKGKKSTFILYIIKTNMIWFAKSIDFLLKELKELLRQNK